MAAELVSVKDRMPEMVEIAIGDRSIYATARYMVFIPVPNTELLDVHVAHMEGDAEHEMAWYDDETAEKLSGVTAWLDGLDGMDGLDWPEEQDRADWPEGV